MQGEDCRQHRIDPIGPIPPPSGRCHGAVTAQPTTEGTLCVVADPSASPVLTSPLLVMASSPSYSSSL